MVTTSSASSWMAEAWHGLRQDSGTLVARGAIAGLVGGMGFLLANMWFAYANGKPGIAPFLAISTVFNAAHHPSLVPTAVPVELGEGAVIHLVLSLSFGMGFGLLAAFLRNLPALLAGAVGYGLALFVLNFEILGRTVFPFFTNPMGPNNVFEGFVHPLIFGGLLVPFFLGRVTSRPSPGIPHGPGTDPDAFATQSGDRP